MYEHFLFKQFQFRIATFKEMIFTSPWNAIKNFLPFNCLSRDHYDLVLTVHFVLNIFLSPRIEVFIVLIISGCSCIRDQAWCHPVRITYMPSFLNYPTISATLILQSISTLTSNSPLRRT